MAFLVCVAGRPVGDLAEVRPPLDWRKNKRQSTRSKEGPEGRESAPVSKIIRPDDRTPSSAGPPEVV